MKSIGACVVGLAVGGLVLGSAGAAQAQDGQTPPPVTQVAPAAPALEVAPTTEVTPTEKIAYVDPNSPTGDTTNDGDPAPMPLRPSRHKESDNDSALDAFRLGAFGGVGFPRPLSLEAFAKIEKTVGLGVEYSVLPAMTLNGIDTTFWALSGDLRVFPFENGFFVGITAGRQHVGASTSLQLPSPYPSIPESVTADTWFINPRIGFLSTWNWGLTLGIDAGVQIPLTASFASTIPTNLPVNVPIATDATDMAHLLGKSVLPTVDLLRVGLLF
jgi:hypothetical protein